jgi:Na+-transporting NADH:ubiquinone oxidoreductase subunit A
MARTIKLRKGYDIKLVGEAPRFELNAEQPKLFAIKPADFNGLTPRLIVEQGAEVKAGDPLFHEKSDESILFTSPVSGEVVEIVRGARRAIQEIRILSDSKVEFKDFGKASPADLSAAEIKAKLLQSGAWTLLRQRPYNRVAKTSDKPKNIFISGFDSAPFGINVEYTVHNSKSNLQHAVDALAKLTEGKIYIGLSIQQKGNSVFESLKNVEITYFDGPHPAGLVGIQIHHTAPINKGDVVWTISAQDLLVVGRLFEEGVYNTERWIALAGADVKRKGYFKTYIGAQVSNLFQNNLSNEHVRIISGNPLNGDTIIKDGFVGTYHQTLCTIEEGDEPELFGWLLPSYPRPSLSKTFPAYIFPNAQYRVNTNMHGEERAFVMTGEYEKVTPMDILPMQLFKACLANDIDNMEALGIYEVVEEDIALCEFICTSKLPLQNILRDGLNYLENEA